MSLSSTLRRAPLRIATGAYILNSGITKLNVDEDTAKSLHGVAAGTYPMVEKVQPRTFSKLLAGGEIAVGATLLAPMVPPFVAGAALAGFSGVLLNLYWRTPGMHEEGSPRPTAQGAPLAKDVWMLGIGTALMADAAFEPAHDKKVEIGTAISRRMKRKDRRARKRAGKTATAIRDGIVEAEIIKHVSRSASELADTVGESAQRTARKARKQGERTSRRAGDATQKFGVKAAERVEQLRSEYVPVAAERARAARDAARDLAGEYVPVAAERARAARDAARDLAGEYVPVAAERARAARDAARDLADEYGPVAAERARAARDAARDLAQEAATKAKAAVK